MICAQDLNDDTRFIEFYNLVFMQSNKLEDGSVRDLANKNIDTGLGLERLAQILQKVGYGNEYMHPSCLSYSLSSLYEKRALKFRLAGDEFPEQWSQAVSLQCIDEWQGLGSTVRFSTYCSSSLFPVGSGA